MSYLDDRNYRKCSKAREKQIMDRVFYRQSLREINENEKSMERLYEYYCSKAVEAENAGYHEQAIRMANQAQKIKKQKEISTNIKNTIEVLHSVQTTNRALVEIAAISQKTAGGLLGKQSVQDLSVMQTELAIARENLQMTLEQSDQYLDEYSEPNQSQIREEDEQYLQELITASQKEKQIKMLRDTQQRLQQIQKNRTIEKERNK